MKPAIKPGLTYFFAGVSAAILLSLLLIEYHDKHASHNYTCADILGTPPRPGYIAILPPGWSATSGIIVFSQDGAKPSPDYRVWNERGKLVCDTNGRDIR